MRMFKIKTNSWPFRFLLLLGCLSAILTNIGCDRPQAGEAVPEISPGVPDGYLPKIMIPNSIVLLPPSPDETSLIFTRDQRISQRNLALMGSTRWDLAASDADQTLPHSINTFACVLNAQITEQDTPRLYMLMRRVAMDAAKSTYPAKNKYMRPRPFMVNNQPTCSPDDEEDLRSDGSYPSGHATVGWACALTLSEIAPDKTAELMRRARAFAQSRVVCNVHWQSDVNEGRTMGAATFAALMLNSQFLTDLAAAKKELAAARSEGLGPDRDCRWEEAVLAEE